MRIIRISHLGRLLAAVVSTAALCSGLSSASEATGNTGTLTGSLRIFGGVATTSRSGLPTSGRVEFQPKLGTARAIKVGKTGQFTVELKPGIYTVFGGPPAWHNTCQVNFGKAFRLGGGQRLKVTVSCIAI